MVKTCLNCANAIWDDDRGMKMCERHNHPIRDPFRYLDCVSHILKENKEQTTESEKT